jgi:hypothetical protein
VRDSASVLIYDVSIALNDPPQPADNVRVVDAGAHFPCENPVIPDEDYFLDFTLPTGVFGAFNFISSTYRLCYFTSTQDIVNKQRIHMRRDNKPADRNPGPVRDQADIVRSHRCLHERYAFVAFTYYGL